MRRSMILAVLAIATALLWVVPARAATTINVATTGNDTTGNGSATSPYRTIGKAMSVASTGDAVNVAAGTYDETVTMKSVALTGAGATSTVIRGGGAGSVISLMGSGDASATIKGFTIRDGRAMAGGGIACVGASLNLLDNRIISNNATIGGGMACEVVTLTARGNVFESNAATTVGGGLLVAGARATMTGNRIIANRAPSQAGLVFMSGTLALSENVIAGNSGISAAGLSCVGSLITISDNQIVDNISDIYGGLYTGNCTGTISGNTVTGNAGFQLYGGGMLLMGGQVLVSRNTVKGNTALAGGGIAAVAMTGGGLVGNTVSGNYGSEGGGVVLLNCSTPVTGNSIVGNTAAIGGGLLTSSSTSTISNNLVARNSGSGGGLLMINSTCTVTNNTVADNKGSSMFGGGITALGASQTVVSNCIVWGNVGTDLSGNVTATFCDVEDATSSPVGISIDPMFVDAAGGDYRLKVGSPAIDKGTAAGAPADDLDGIPRPQDGDANGTPVVDMGAFETPYMAANLDATSTASASITVDSRFTGATQMRVDLGAGFGAWQPYADRVTAVLPGDDGTKTARAEYQYGGGKSIVRADSIVLSRPRTVLSLSRSAATVNYGARVALTGSLVSSAGPAGGRAVALWRSQDGGAHFSRDGTATTGADGRFSASRSMTQNTKYAARFATDPGFLGSASATVTVACRAYLPRPVVAPRSPRAGAYLTITGFLKPKHSGKTTLYLLKRRGRTYVRIRTLSARNSAFRGYTRYRLRYRIGAAGQYGVQAYHKDATHAVTKSPVRYFTAR